MTCVAMALAYLGKQRANHYRHFAQWEDELLQRTEDNGWDRHEPGAMKKMVELYGARDDLLIVQGWDAVGKALQQTIDHLRDSLPAITHGYLTSAGHIVCLTGVRLNGVGKPEWWHVTDPYGEFFGYVNRFVSKI